MRGEMAGRGALVALPRRTRMRRRKLCVRSGAVMVFAVCVCMCEEWSCDGVRCVEWVCMWG